MNTGKRRLATVWCKVALWATAVIDLSACSGLGVDPKPHFESSNQNDKTKVVLSVEDIWTGQLLESGMVEERFCQSSNVPLKHIVFVSEAIGKVAKEDLPMGTIICRDEIAPPKMPDAAQDWIFKYSDAVLSKRVGKLIAIKGTITDWVIDGQHSNDECAILSSDRSTYVRIGYPCKSAKSKDGEQHGFAAQRAKWIKELSNKVVIARGVLRRCESVGANSKPSHAHFMFDQHGLIITKSSW